MPDVKMPILYQRSLNPAQEVTIRCCMQLMLVLMQQYSRLFQFMMATASQQGPCPSASRLGPTEVRNSSMAKDSRISCFDASSGSSGSCVWHDASHILSRLTFIVNVASYSKHVVIHIPFLDVRYLLCGISTNSISPQCQTSDVCCVHSICKRQAVDRCPRTLQVPTGIGPPGPSETPPLFA